MKKRKVVHTTNGLSPYRVAFWNELSKYLDVTVLVEREELPTRDKEWVSNENIKFHVIYLTPTIMFGEGALCRDIVKHLKAFRNDYIIIGSYATLSGIYAIRYLKRKHIPFTIEIDGGIIPKHDMKKILKTYLISAASGWFSPSEQGDQYLLAYGADEKDIYRYPFTSIREKAISCPLEKAERLLIRKELGITTENMVLYVGRFLSWKGIDVLIQAAKGLGDTTLVLAGGNKEDLETCYGCDESSRKENIMCLGFKKEEQLKAYYQAADVLVVPTRGEVWGLVVNEAMAYGTPVIASDMCGAGLCLVEDGITGYLYEVENVKQLQFELQSLLNDENLRMRMAEQCHLKISNYTIEKMACRFGDIINKGMHNSRS